MNLDERLQKDLSPDIYCLVHNKIVNLEQQCKTQKEAIDKAINDLNIIIDIVREQPLGSDCWIIDRLEANKSILKEVE